MTHWLGIDPGRNSGAVVLVSPTQRTRGRARELGNVSRWWVYSRMRRSTGEVLRVRSSHSEEFEQPNLPTLATGLLIELRHLRATSHKGQLFASCEGLFIPRMQKPKPGERGKYQFDPTNVLHLAESVGHLLGPLLSEVEPFQAPSWAPVAPVTDGVFRPLARHWRPAHGIPARTPQAEAEAMAVRVSQRVLTWPAPARLAELTKGELGAVHEAALIGMAGHHYSATVRAS